MDHIADIVVIGAGAVGCAIARELSRYELDVAVLEKESDVAAGTSGRNSAVVHAGFNSKPGSLMAKLCVEGNLGFEKVCRELDVPYKKTGKLVVALNKDDIKGIEKLMNAGEQNGVPGLRLIDKDEMKKFEPNVNGMAAMVSSETAITNPFIYTVALAENAVVNGVKFYFDSEVKGISKKDGRFRIKAGENYFYCKYLINSAGLYSDTISKMAGDKDYKIYPCRGQYYILDKRAGEFLKMPVYPVPRQGEGGLGVHITPTIEGNILIGPSSEYIQTKCDCGTTSEVMKKLLNEAKELLPSINFRQVIRNYAGIRSKLVDPSKGGFGDFIIKESDKTPNLINLIGIESPGLTASVPIAKMMAGILNGKEILKEKKNFIKERKGIVAFRDLPLNEKIRLIKEEPDYGEIVCRCEGITRKEIIQAIENPLGVKTIAGIKYRARAMMGRCQGGYCLTRIVEILIKNYGLSPEEITERGRNSKLFIGKVK